MDVDSVFKRPAPPSLKRKLAAPAEDQLHRADQVTIHDEKDDDETVEYVGGQSGDDNAGDDEEEGRFYEEGVDGDYAELLSLVDAAEDIKIERLDTTGIRRMLLKLEDCINKNQIMRLKFPNDPFKFGESEADLDEAIKHLLALAQAPEHYPELIQQNSLPSLLGLLAHENTDIAIDVVELLNELLDEDLANDENQPAIEALVDALMEQQVMELLVHNMKRLKPTDPADRQGIFQTLGVFENIVSVNSAYAKDALKTGLLDWLLQQMRLREADANRHYASELLAILVQEESENRAKLVQHGGMDVVLRALSQYKRKDPEDGEVEEHVENLFNILCSMLLEPIGRSMFLEAEGIELMLIMLREKKFARLRALKVISHAVGGHDAAASACCMRLIEARGLAPLFSALMQKDRKRLKKAYKAYSQVDDEEHSVTIIAALFRSLPNEADAQAGALSPRTRLLFKFLDDNMEKLDRLLELRTNWWTRVKAVDDTIEEQRRRHQLKRRHAELEDDDDESEEDEDALALHPLVVEMRRLDAGLATVQMTDLILAQLVLQDASLLQHVRMLLRRHNLSFEDVIDDITEYADAIKDQEDASEEEQRATQRERRRGIALARQLALCCKSDGKQTAE